MTVLYLHILSFNVSDKYERSLAVFELINKEKFFLILLRSSFIAVVPFSIFELKEKEEARG
jgi:hypothetical protein